MEAISVFSLSMDTVQEVFWMSDFVKAHTRMSDSVCSCVLACMKACLWVCMSVALGLYLKLGQTGLRETSKE